jgi:hypothetical protein
MFEIPSLGERAGEAAHCRFGQTCAFDEVSIAEQCSPRAKRAQYFKTTFE